MPRISIIMGIYNCDKYLRESIDSIINQTYKDWELIMCDDNSSDNTYKIAMEYSEKYKDQIKVLRNDINRGLNYTLNKCAEIAIGEYIARQDGDDISIDKRLEKEISFLDNNKEYALVTSSMITFDESGEWGIIKNAEFPTKFDFIKGSPINHAPCMIRKEVFDEVQGYTVDKKLLRVEDYHLWFKLYSKGYKAHSIQEPLYKMRDDHNAQKRRNWNNRINEMKVKIIGFKMLKIPKRYYIYVFRPILVGMLPKNLYNKLHRRKLKKINE